MCLSLFLNCTKDVDFNQTSDLEIDPILESSIVFIEASADNLITDGRELSIKSDFIELEVFNNGFIRDNLRKVDLIIEATNTLPRDFSYTLNFFDDAGNILQNNTFLISEAPSNTITFENDNLDVIKNTTSIQFTIEMLAGTPITSASQGRVSIKSKGIFYFNLDL